MAMILRWGFSLIALCLIVYGLFFMFAHPIDQFGLRGFRHFLFLLHVSIFLYGVDIVRNELTR
ncbi:hypothetical protein CAY60_009900 [Shouchella clausii]|jgi:hypothetical protein|uniref:Uncharacterized protein n=2 Tax=Shouchella TaxID=2893057 RepID=A0A268P1L9_SHOCL|nr:MULTISPECIES: hypothetical protein [Shouchella]MCM3313413.1 hypothetical protein [Psychrobacillus sp. MER TA 17]ALA54397.1 hypothetical protein DB29_03569 [Shouchella clausii]KKI84727.1 hypothetical protein WZ76_19340 [Shouchella clausii]MBU3232492.1 hypothetical protein [Shouchella clausii]MBU3265870.1 hypothetical protein [Shouchella clausii]